MVRILTVTVDLMACLAVFLQTHRGASVYFVHAEDPVEVHGAKIAKGGHV